MLAPGAWRDAMAAAAPPSRDAITGRNVSSGVERSASVNPTMRDRLVRSPRCTAAPLPACEQPMATASTHQPVATLQARPVTASAVAAVSSTLPLSTTTTREVHGCSERNATIAASVAGSRPDSL